ncbi:hypothetical protein OSB04_019512 [Centaurea solstitialis]|uniref:Retrotransposon gag domain-containing protein n=1 Tax=Centaurea solstitialis TaxID=347529 RepID=A0AA38SS53_9ASTR|nr:hypothetical protein OSB04_019512 [Centaurea solstitialis]
MEEEFLQLKQGMMSVQEYTTRFIEKSRFAEIYVPTEERRVERYIWGLKGSIREFAAINAAELIERDKDRQASERIGEKRIWDGQVSDESMVLGDISEAETFQEGMPKVDEGLNRSFDWSIARGDNPSRAPSRAFQMIEEGARERTNVVSGTFLAAFVLEPVNFDSYINC